MCVIVVAELESKLSSTEQQRDQLLTDVNSMKAELEELRAANSRSKPGPVSGGGVNCEAECGAGDGLSHERSQAEGGVDSAALIEQYRVEAESARVNAERLRCENAKLKFQLEQSCDDVETLRQTLEAAEAELELMDQKPQLMEPKPQLETEAELEQMTQKPQLMEPKPQLETEAELVRMTQKPQLMEPKPQLETEAELERMTQKPQLMEQKAQLETEAAAAANLDTMADDVAVDLSNCKPVLIDVAVETPSCEPTTEALLAAGAVNVFLCILALCYEFSDSLLKNIQNRSTFILSDVVKIWYCNSVVRLRSWIF